jgi:ABC-type transport system substrate-binding protein
MNGYDERRLTKQGYWSETVVSRRRLLRTSAAAGAAGLFLAACGGGGEERTASLDFQKPVDSSARAVRGGIFPSAEPNDIPTMDIITNGSPAVGQVRSWVYSQLLQFKTGVLKPGDGSVEGSLARDWEVSPDGLQITMRLKDDARWDERAPTSGRALTSQDVKYAWDRFVKEGNRRVDLVNRLNPEAPFLDTVTTPDNRTVVFKLATADRLAIELLSTGSYLTIVPIEAEDKLDIRKEARGIGPWIISDYVPSRSIHYRRNPNWFNKDRPFLDGFDTVFVSDYAARLAQFKSGNVWNDVVETNDVITIKSEHPELLVYRGEFPTNWPFLSFGFEPSTIFKDERIRQAASMSIDREAFMETFYNTEGFRSAGFPFEVRYATGLTGAWDPYWLDPRGKNFGPSAKYLSFNLEEAKKLMAAAGYASGFDTELTYSYNNNYGADFSRKGEVLAQMFTEAGIRAKPNVVEHTTVFLAKYVQEPNRSFKGIASGLKSGAIDASLALFRYFHSNQFNTVMGRPGPDPALEDLLSKARYEVDKDKRLSMTHEAQRHIAKAAWAIPHPGATAEVTLGWPWVQNQGVFQPWIGGGNIPAQANTQLWIDKSKVKA